MVLTLYMTPLSPPSRAVLLTAKALGLKLDIKNVELTKGENKKSDFTKINPQQKVPVLDDGGFVICDSHAINSYLVQKYGQNDSLYPKDYQKRAIVDERLHFDTGSLFSLVRDIAGPIFLRKTKDVPEDKAKTVINNLGYLEKILDGKKLWAAGDQLTIADFSLATTVTALDVFVPLDQELYPNIYKWIKRVEALPYFHEINEPGSKIFRDLVAKSRL